MEDKKFCKFCGEQIDKESIVCPKCGKAVRIGFEIDKDSKVRVCKSCGAKLK